jgi:8-oxo-dGTP diphosphatase
MKERYKVIPEVFVMIVQEGKVLLGKRANTGYWDGSWGLPGGHGEEHETLRQGAAREAREELSIHIEPSDLNLVLVQHRWCNDKDNPHARVGFYFVPQRFRGMVRNVEPEKCDGLDYFVLDALPENIVPHVREALSCYRQGLRYSEFDWDTR